jgi:serine/threonine-protein kinase
MPALVPRLAGMSQADAVSALEKAGLALGTVQRRIGPQSPGTVIGQSVKAETQVARGSTVDLVIATAGGKPVKVPDLVGDDQQKATRKLQEKQLQPGAVRTRASCETPGEVIEQNPREDEKVPAGTAVDLVVARSGGGTSVPDVRRLSQSDAEQTLRARGLVVKKVRSQQTDSQPAGTVVGQRPKPDTPLAQGCPVELDVAAAAPKVSVPTFVGMSEGDARSRLPHGAGALFSDFSLGTVSYQETREVAAGTVISQRPEPGIQVSARSATPVNLVIARSASGSDQPPPDGGGDRGSGSPGVNRGGIDRRVSLVTVPDVRQRTYQEAEKILADAGLRCTIAAGNAGVVTKQSLEPGATARRGQTVSVTLSGDIR